MQSTNFFHAQIGRLKEVSGCTEDQQIADLLGMGKAAFSARKTRGSFPVDKLHSLAGQRPELEIDVHYVLTGKSTKEVATKMVGNIPAELAKLRGRRSHAVIAKKAGVSPEDWAAFEAKSRPVTSDFMKKVIAAFPEADPMELLGAQKREISTQHYLEMVLLQNYRSCTAPAQELIRQQAAMLATKPEKTP